MESVINYKQLPEESSEAYAAFCVYRDCHPYERCIALVEERLGRSVGHWVGQNRWVDRAEEWDEYIDSRKRAARAIEFEKRELEQFQGLKNLQGITLANIELWEEALLNGGVDDRQLPNMSLKESRKTLETLVKLYRLMNSEATDIVENKKKESTVDLTTLSTDELLKLKDLQNRVRK